MAVYVDDSNIPASVPNGRVTHTSRWSHLFADTQEELHEFAGQLGLRRAYFQPGKPRGDGTPSPLWHYDVTAGKRQQALRLGARPVTWRESVEIIKAREAATARRQTADKASHEAGLACRAGNYVTAGQLLDEARAADPSRSALWAERTAQVHAAAREAAAAAAGTNDGQPLAETVRTRLEAAGVTADQPGMEFVTRWNAARLADAQALAEAPEGEHA